MLLPPCCERPAWWLRGEVPTLPTLRSATTPPSTTTCHIAAIHQWGSSLCAQYDLCYALLSYSIAIQAMCNCPTPSAGGWSWTSSGCLPSKLQCSPTLRQRLCSRMAWYVHLYIHKCAHICIYEQPRYVHIQMYMYVSIYIYYTYNMHIVYMHTYMHTSAHASMCMWHMCPTCPTSEETRTQVGVSQHLRPLWDDFFINIHCLPFWLWVLYIGCFRSETTDPG